MTETDFYNMKYFVILLLLAGFVFSVAYAQYHGDVEFYHLSVETDSKQYSILSQSITNKFIDVFYDDKAGSLIFCISESADLTDSAAVTMNQHSLSELFSSGNTQDPNNMLVLINGEEQPYKTVKDNNVVSWVFQIPPNSDEFELILSSERFGVGNYQLEDVPNSLPRTYPPLKQEHLGVPYDEIQCKNNLVKVLKKSDNTPVCITTEKKSKLIQRDWIQFQFSFCGADGFDSDGNPNKSNSTHIWDGNYCKWQPIGDFESKPNILLDIASIEENRIVLNPTDTCAHVSLRLLSADKLEQYQSRDKEVRFFEITENDLEKLHVLDELIQATHHLEFTTNDDARAEMGLRELVDYEFFIMEKAIEKYNDSQDDYFIKLDGNLDEKLADPKPQGFSNEFLSPQLVYDDNVYVLSHTVFWVANEHEIQSMSVHLQDSIDNDKKFITLTEKDMESIPKIKQAIEKIGTEFESIHASKGLPENPDWNEYREWFEQKKTEQFNLDEIYVPGFVYNDEYYDLGFPIC